MCLDAPAAQTEARNDNLQVSTAGVLPVQATGYGSSAGTSTGEANVQWARSETNTASDAFIWKRCTIPTCCDVATQIEAKAFSNPPTIADG